MYIIGHILTLCGLYFLYENELVIGSIVFFMGGFLAKKIYISIRSFGLILMVSSTAYGYHNGYELLILFLIFIGFVLASFNTKHTSDRESWGFDMDFSSFGSGDGDGD